MNIVPPQKEIPIELPNCFLVTEPASKTIKDVVQSAAACCRVLASSLHLYTFADAKEYATQYTLQLKAVYNYLQQNPNYASPVMLADMIQAVSLIIAARAGSNAAPGNFTSYFPVEIHALAIDLQHKLKELNRIVFEQQYKV